MRIAIVSPYSWTYAGGVNRHVEALAEALIERGHEVRVLAPVGPAGPPQPAAPPRARRAASRPDYLIPLGRTVGFGANGAVSNLSAFPDCRDHDAARAPRRALRRGPCARAGGPAARVGRLLVSGRAGGRHLPRLLHQADARTGSRSCSGRGASSTSSRPDRRLRGRGVDGPALVRRQYTVIPNGVDVDAPPSGPSRARRSFGCCSWAARRSARGCRCCCRLSRAWSSTCRRG